MLTDQTAEPNSRFWSSAVTVSFGIPYFAISLALNVLLTLMIVIRLIIHIKNVRKAMGVHAAGTIGLYRTVVTVFIESSALYTVTFLLYIGPWSALNYAQYLFFPPLAQIQVRAASTFS
jgi:hypothetical protein